MYLEQHESYKKYQENFIDVACLMLVTMIIELQKQYESVEAFAMIEHLKKMFKG